MDIFELTSQRPLSVALSLVSSQQPILEKIRQQNRHVFHKYLLLTKSLDSDSEVILPSELIKGLTSILNIIKELDCHDEVFALILAGISDEKRQPGTRKTTFVKPNKSIELLEYLLEKHSQHILNPKTSVVLDMASAPEFLDLLHQSYATTTDREETARNINLLCEKYVEHKKWLKLKNNFSSWLYNKENAVRGLSITGEAQTALKWAQNALNQTNTSDTIVQLVEHYKQSSSD